MDTPKKIPRFGVLAIQKGFVSREQLYKAMKEQIDRELDGLESRLIGSLLYDLKYITLEQIDEILEEMHKAKS